MKRRNLALIGRVVAVIAAALAMIAMVSPAQAEPEPAVAVGVAVAMTETDSISIRHSTAGTFGMSTASEEPIAIQTACTWPPCGEIYNHTDGWFDIKRQDCKDCGWIYDSVGPGQHKGGYWNDGIDWDAFAVPYRCTVWTRGAGVIDNYSVSPQKWVSFDSTVTVHIDQYSCRGT